MKHFEVLNGKLSIPFDSKVNDYTIYLIDGATKIEANYTLINDTYQVEIQEDEKKAIYVVMEKGEEIEKYTFYKDIKETTPVFQETTSKTDTQQNINPNIRIYVLGVCAIIILALFKMIVLGFKKKTK